MSGFERKKPMVSAYVSPHIKQRLSELVKTGEFASESDIMNTAVIEWFTRHEKKLKEEERRSDRLIKILENDPELKAKVLEGLEK